MAGALFGALFMFAPHFALAADLTLSPGTGSVAVGAKLSVKVTIVPGTDSVNAADATIAFDPALLSVDSISKDGSLFSLWTADPAFDNAAGTVTLSGGTPTAFTKTGTIITIIFKGKAAGAASVTFTKGSILAADGKGTDVYKNGNGGAYVVTAAGPPPASAPPADTTTDASGGGGDGSPPVSPIISSPTHQKPDSWYGTSTAVFTWTMPADVTAVRTLISQKANDAPTVTVKGGATTTQKVVGIPDGVSYFYVQGKNASGWGDVGSFKVQIDTAPPSTFDIAVQEPGADGGVTKLAFKTDDALSGMDHYQIIVGTSTPVNVSVKDVPDGTYPVPPNPGGAQPVKIRAYDKAGNFIEVIKTLTVPKVDKPKPASATPDAAPVAASSGFGFEGILLVILALITGGIVAFNMYSRKTVIRENERWLAAVLEVRYKNDRIFSAMREEFEQMINNFDEKPQLTPAERNLLEGIKEVLDISEELVDTSIEDLKKMVRNQT
jgi:hypothetical protein